MSLLVEVFPAGPLQCNCSIVGCTETKEAIVVDPGGDVDKIIARLDKHGFKVKYLVHTHAHFDHILGTRGMHEKTGAEICLHKEDQELYANLGMQCERFGFEFDEPLPVGKYIEDEQRLDFGQHSTSHPMPKGMHLSCFLEIPCFNDRLAVPISGAEILMP